jgi:hypothetical protein
MTNSRDLIKAAQVAADLAVETILAGMKDNFNLSIQQLSQYNRAARHTRRIEMFENLSPAERIDRAKAKMKRVVHHFLYFLELHENNVFIVYSPGLSSQIPESFAANAFNVFQRGCHQFEIVRLCALWDNPEADKENILTVVELVDSTCVRDMLSEDERQYWLNSDGGLINPSDDPVVRSRRDRASRRMQKNMQISAVIISCRRLNRPRILRNLRSLLVS